MVADAAAGAWTDGGVTRGGTAIAGGAALGETGVLAAGGVAGTLGGITTTDGGRYVAATEAGVTILGAGGVTCGASVGGLGATAFRVDAAGADALASTAGGVTGGRAGGRTAGASATLFC